MAVTVKITSKGLFNKVKSINLKDILDNCNLKYGSNNEFYILKENEMKENTCILYNPSKIGRGIFFDARSISQGEITLSINIPTTRAEIKDFIKVVSEIERQFKKASIYCEEKEKEYTLSQLVDSEDEIAQFSVESLNSFCANTEYEQCILTLALFPWFMDNEKRQEYISCKNLDDFEETLHRLQAEDLYYAKPSLMHNKVDDKNYACYVLTANCASIFPIKATEFLNLDQIKIEDGLIQFFIFEEKKMLDGIYQYDKFIEYMNKYGVEKFDNQHIIIPDTFSKDEILKMINEITSK